MSPSIFAEPLPPLSKRQPRRDVRCALRALVGWPAHIGTH
jgi:hypothetical protein